MIKMVSVSPLQLNNYNALNYATLLYHRSSEILIGMGNIVKIYHDVFTGNSKDATAMRILLQPRVAKLGWNFRHLRSDIFVGHFTRIF